MPNSSPEDPIQAVIELRQQNAALAAQIQSLTAAAAQDRQRADASERNNAVTSAMAGLEFQSDNAKAMARDMVLGQLRRTDNGQLVAGDGKTLEAFVQDLIVRDNPYLLTSVRTGGTSFSAGSPPRGGRVGFDLDDIKPGMSAEARSAARQAIDAALR